MIERARAEEFARDWVESWNSHDLDRVLAHYADDFEMTMRWGEIEGDTWSIPADRYKTGVEHVVPLTREAVALVGKRPKNAKAVPYVVSSTRGKKPFSGYSKAKAELDRQIAAIRKKARREAMPRWTLHDLRRTAKTLMSRAGVRPDVSERVLGHVIAGVAGTYDRWAYLDEKREALAKLAAMVETILHPPAKDSNVVSITRDEARAGAVA